LLRGVNIFVKNVTVSFDVNPYDLVNITRRYILEHSNLHIHCHKKQNLTRSSGILTSDSDHNAPPTYTK